MKSLRIRDYGQEGRPAVYEKVETESGDRIQVRASAHRTVDGPEGKREESVTFIPDTFANRAQFLGHIKVTEVCEEDGSGGWLRLSSAWMENVFAPCRGGDPRLPAQPSTEGETDNLETVVAGLADVLNLDPAAQLAVVTSKDCPRALLEEIVASDDAALSPAAKSKAARLLRPTSGGAGPKESAPKTAPKTAPKPKAKG